jgi:hypothetical protein
MIWTGVFSLAHQYFTDSFIASKSTLGYCPFLSNTGLWPQTTVVGVKFQHQISRQRASYTRLIWRFKQMVE